MLNESTIVNESMTRNEETVDGMYPLGALITRSVERAVYATEFGEGESSVPAMISIREVEPAEAEELSRRLMDARQLAHPNLLKIYATGSSTLNGVPVFYLVMERAEESLEAVLADRALTQRETLDMLAPTLEALGYLHKKGYAHSRLKPSNVMAVNDQLKLSTDSVVRVSDGEAADGTREEDMRALGVLIFQALTQKIPKPDEHWGLQGFQEIPHPLADIVRHCLDPDRARRWNVEQVKAGLNPPVIAAGTVGTAAKLGAADEIGPKKLPPLEDDEDEEDRKPRVPKWIYAGVAALILAVIMVAVARRNDSTPAAIPAVAVTQGDRPDPRDQVSPTETAAPQTAAPLAAKPSAGRKASGWLVIVGAYRSRELAEKRLRAMTKRWPNFNISIFDRQGEKAPYLLVLGQNLSEDQAEALRARAAKSRLTGDAYIKRMM